ncbi:hypothetical protein D0T51_03510 [Parabacteroides sp. 52]|nr:hypothetical protein [Parabacteroides sp. 52]
MSYPCFIHYYIESMKWLFFLKQSNRLKAGMFYCRWASATLTMLFSNIVERVQQYCRCPSATE